MTVSRTQFLDRFPEFNNTDIDTTLVDAILAEAHRMVNTTVWAALRDDGIKYKTASMLADSAFGRSARLSDDDRMNVYEARYRELQRMVSAGCRNT